MNKSTSALPALASLLLLSLVAGCGGGSSNTPSPLPMGPSNSPSNPDNPFVPVDPDIPAEPVAASVKILQSSPDTGASNVLIDEAVSLTLNESIEPSSANQDTVVLSDGNGDIVPGNITVNEDTIVFTPNNNLTLGQRYLLELRSGITAISGNSIADFQVIEFSTIEGIEVSSMSPADGSLEVGIESALVITFNKIIDPSTVTENSIEVTPDTFVEGNFRSVLEGDITVGDNELTFVPEGGLWQEYETTYTVRVNDLRSIDNEPLITPPSASFTSVFWDSGYVYNLFVETANPRNRSLQLFDTDNILMSDQAAFGNEDRWHFTDNGNGFWGIRNLAKSDFDWLEGGDGSGLAVLKNAFVDNDLFTGQQWKPISFNPFDDREQFRGESPLNYFLTNNFLGEDRVLGVLLDDSSGLRSGRMQPRQNNINTLWWFKRDTKLLFDF